jgi:methyl-accepting chemotaxis protein
MKNVPLLFQRKWRGVFIEPFIQIKMGVYVLLLSFLYTSTLALFIWDIYEEQFFRFEETFLGENAEFLFQESGQLTFITLLGILVVLFIVFLILAIARRTHRMFGPMVAVDRFIDTITQGDYSQRIQTREGDDFKDLADSLNRMAESFEKNGVK